MAEMHPVRWLAGHASTGVKELPRNGAWLVAKALRAPAALGGGDGRSENGSGDGGGFTEVRAAGRRGATDGLRRVTTTIAQAVPGIHDPVETRIKRAEAAVADARRAEQEALEEARQAGEQAESARAVAEEARQRVRDAQRDAKAEVDRRTREAREHYHHLVDREHDRASQEAADRVDRVAGEMDARTAEARESAERAAASAQARIDDAHERMSAARALAAEATAAAQELAEQAHAQARAAAEEAEERAGSADEVVRQAREAEDVLARNTAKAVRAEAREPAPERLTDHTKAELLTLAGPLEITGASRMTKAQLVRAVRNASRTRPSRSRSGTASRAGTGRGGKRS